MKSTSSIIHKLDEITINRIAAGEVVQNPSSALKEMLENSLDAGSTAISVVAKGGGMNLLQIQDDGHGIRKEDLAIVCERFTTSKIVCFEDLKNVTTFGFRGEALASITHVAHVVIVTKTSEQSCAYKAKYSDGKLVPFKTGEKAEPKPCAGTVGTSITVEDLFYNMSTRRKAFKNNSEQYQKILDVVTRYAIHYGDQNVSFTCKKHGQASADLHTPTITSTKGNISIIYGNILAKELLSLKFSNTSAKCHSNNNDNSNSQTNINLHAITTIESPNVPIFSCNGYVTNANYSCKKSIFILFINNRLVESVSIKRIIESVYCDILPKHSHPFIYLSIVMPSHHVDVNVHPTKKEVHFLYEVELLEVLHNELQTLLKSANNSRTFYTQSLLLPNFSTQSLVIPDDGDSSNSNGKVFASKTSSACYQSNRMISNNNNVANVTQNSLLFVEDDNQVNDDDDEEVEGGEDGEDAFVEGEAHRGSDTSTSLNHASPDTTNKGKKRSMESFLNNDLPIDYLMGSASASSSSSSSSSSGISVPRPTSSAPTTSTSSSASNHTRSIPANKLVRVDATSSKIDSYFTTLSKPCQRMASPSSTSLSVNPRGGHMMTPDSDSEADQESLLRSDVYYESSQQHLDDCPIRNIDTSIIPIKQGEGQGIESTGPGEQRDVATTPVDIAFDIDSSLPSCTSSSPSTAVGAFARSACRCCVNIRYSRRTRASGSRTSSSIAQPPFTVNDADDNAMNAYNEDNDFLPLVPPEQLVLNASTNTLTRTGAISSTNQDVEMQGEFLAPYHLKDPASIEPPPAPSPLSLATTEAIDQLTDELKANRHDGLHKILHCNTLVGVINSEYLLIQYSSRLLLLNFQSFSRHLFYQLAIQQIGKLSILKLENEVDVGQFLLAGLELPEAQWSPQDGDKQLLVSSMLSILSDHASRLYELFRIGFEKRSNGSVYLTSMPVLLRSHRPVPEHLPLFLLRLTTEVPRTKKAESEGEGDGEGDDYLYIKSVALELALFYSKFEVKESQDGVHENMNESLNVDASSATATDNAAALGSDAGSQVDGGYLSERSVDTLTRLVWPAVKAKLVAPRECADDGSIVQIAALEQLYKIFERC